MAITPEQRACNTAIRLRNAADSADGLTIQYTNGDSSFYIVSTSIANELISAGSAVSAE
jgi:hypothetical protein